MRPATISTTLVTAWFLLTSSALATSGQPTQPRNPEIRYHEYLSAWDAAVQSRLMAAMADPSAARRVRPPRKVKAPAVVYPTAAIQAGLEGKVVLEARIDLKGRVAQFALEEGEPLLVAAAKEALSKWRFKPLKFDASEWEMRFRCEVEFDLP